jgi:hypothetical protein
MPGRQTGRCRRGVLHRAIDRRSRRARCVHCTSRPLSRSALRPVRRKRGQIDYTPKALTVTTRTSPFGRAVVVKADRDRVQRRPIGRGGPSPRSHWFSTQTCVHWSSKFNAHFLPRADGRVFGPDSSQSIIGEASLHRKPTNTHSWPRDALKPRTPMSSIRTIIAYADPQPRALMMKQAVTPNRHVLRISIVLTDRSGE